MSDPNVPQHRKIEFETFIRGDHGPTAPATAAIRSDADLRKFFGGNPPRTLVPVKFGSEMLLGIALGRKPSPGYSIEVLQVDLETGGFVGIRFSVRYRVLLDPVKSRSDAVSHPFTLVKLKEVITGADCEFIEQK